MGLMRADTLNAINICEDCAWSPQRKSDFQYYCYYFDEHYNFSSDQFASKSVPNGTPQFQLKMHPCSHFHSKPSDMEKGAEFAKYFQNKQQIEASTTRSWVSIVIAIVSIVISALVAKYK